jgi:hypothetical protein
METNSYIEIKDYIFNKLKKVEGGLAHDRIKEEISNAKKVIDSVGLEMFSTIISANLLTNLSDDDWERIQRELETHFDVKMQNGILIQGTEQQERDSTWWTSIEKQNGENYYWNRFFNELTNTLPPEVVKTIDVDTDLVMNNIENPKTLSFSRYGMVVGHVQSGKTGNYSALVCKAADAGYKFIVIIAGGINNLRNQTQKRLNESFIGQTNGVQVGAGKGNSHKKSLPLSLTTVNSDFNKQDADRLAQGLNFDNISVPVLLVIKKNTRTLDNVIDWLQKQYKNKVSSHAMLVIDDESDYASINTKEEQDPTAINKKLRQLLSLFQKSAYVAYTATPYANIFIDHNAEIEELGKDLFPKDFIYALEAPTNYFGAKKIFLDTDDKHLIPISDYNTDIPTDHKSDFKIADIPDSLMKAIRLFTLNISVRSLRGSGKKHNSMLIHATRFTGVHILLATLIEKYLKEIKEDVSAFGKLTDARQQSQIIKDLNDTFDEYLSGIEFEWNEVISNLTDLIDSIVVREVHQKTSVPLEYREDITTNAIVIGGTSLARGYTLEGLSISYFLRNTVFYDTLMQMGRWFGYRPGYEDLCRIFMPMEKINDFAEIIRSTEELFSDFRIMAENKKTPNDFGLAIQENPNSALQITARNKQKNVHEFYHSMRLDGKAKETSQFSKQKADNEYNLSVIKKMVADISNQKEYIPKNLNKLWPDIKRESIIRFLNEYKIHSIDPLGITARMPIAFIREYAKERDTNWDVALYSGKGVKYKLTESITIQKEQRKVSVKDDILELKNRQVSSGNSESISLEKSAGISDDRISARSELKRPLLMLHILEPEYVQTEFDEIKDLPAFGVSFPGTVLSNEKTIRLKVNTVYYQNLLKELEYEKETDD